MLIKCPECGNDISDTSKKCIHCGYRFPREKKRNKGLVVILVIVSLVVVLFAVDYFAFGLKFTVKVLPQAEAIAPLNSVEKRVAGYISDFKQSLKDPSSMKINGDIVLYKNDSSEYLYFTISATNSFGAMITRECIYSNGFFLGYMDDNPNSMSASVKSEMFAASITKILIDATLEDKAEGLINDQAEMLSKITVINGSKISKAVGCAYEK